MRPLSLFEGLLQKRGLDRRLLDANPWWRGERMFGISPMKRWAYEPTLKSLVRGLAPVTVLRGPRQVGKTTLLNQIINALLDQGVHPHRIFRMQFDDIPEMQGMKSPILDKECVQRPLRGLGHQRGQLCQ